MIITYQYPSFRLEYEPATGNVWTYYADGSSCLVWANEEDEKHAKALGITPGEHKILHEIIHQQLSLAIGEETCPIVWAQAHGLPMLPKYERREQMIMALTYMFLQVPMPYLDWWNRIAWVQQQVSNPYWLLKEIGDVFQQFTKN